MASISTRKKSASAPDLQKAFLTRVRPRQLSMFTVVYEQRSILKASKILQLTQSTVSKSLSELETDLGDGLFARSSRGVVPTRTGDALYRHARQILGSLRRAADDLGQIRAGDNGQVVVGIRPITSMIVGKAIARFKVRHPKVNVRILYGDDENQLDALMLGDLDFVFGRLHEDRLRLGLMSETLYDDAPQVVVRHDHCILKKGGRRPVLADLIDDPWILPHPDAHGRRYAERIFQVANLPLPANIVETVSLGIIRSMLLEVPNMVSFVTAHTLNDDIERKVFTVAPIRFATRFSPIGFTFRSDGAVQPAVTAFQACLRETARPYMSPRQSSKRRSAAARN